MFHRKTKITQHNIFLIDGVGALISTLLLALVILPNHFLFGVEPTLLQLLSIGASILALYSLLSHFILRATRSVFILIIAILNILYSLSTTVFVLIINPELTDLGFFYFLIEVMLILFLSMIEIKLYREN